MFLLFSLVALGGCNGQQDKEKSIDSAPEAIDLKNQPLKIGLLPIEDALPFYVAESKGMFKDAGMDVQLIPFASAVERDAALQAGQIDGEVADIIAAALLKKGGTEVRIGAVALGVTPKEGRFALLASPKSKIKKVEELKNIPVAISENTIIEYVSDQLLLNAGLKSEEIKKIGIPKIPVRLQMLMQDQIKAALLPDPLATLAEKQGAILILDDTTDNISQVVIILSKKAIEEKQEAVRELIKIFGRAGQELNNNPDQYRSLFIEKARIPEPLKDTYKSPTFSEMQVPQEKDVVRVLEWMVKKGLLEKAYSYDEIVDASLVK